MGGLLHPQSLSRDPDQDFQAYFSHIGPDVRLSYGPRPCQERHGTIFGVRLRSSCFRHNWSSKIVIVLVRLITIEASVIDVFAVVTAASVYDASHCAAFHSQNVGETWPLWPATVQKHYITLHSESPRRMSSSKSFPFAYRGCFCQ